MAVSDDKAVEAIIELSKLARHRFDIRHDREWKLAFTLWTAFGVATGFVLASNEWRPTAAMSILLGVLSFIVFCVFSWWALLRRKWDDSDIQMSYFWESALESLIGKERHPAFQPPGWIRFGHAGASAPPVTYWHPNTIGQIVTTAIFAAMLVGSLWIKAAQLPDRSGAKVTIEGQQGTIGVEKINVGASSTQQP